LGRAGECGKRALINGYKTPLREKYPLLLIMGLTMRVYAKVGSIVNTRLNGFSI
jgi:hypothetical protein